MTDNLMNNVGLWGIIWSSCVPNILGATKNSECETIEKLSLTENSMGWFDSETSFVFQVSI